MKPKTAALALCLIVPALLLNSCLVVGNRGGIDAGGTIGQQLLDLQKAKSAGLISQEEYNKQRNKVLGYPTGD